MGLDVLLLLFVFSIAVACIELDAASVGQWMLSRPIVAGPVCGFVFGQVEFGVQAGILIELFTLPSLPVGSVVLLNATVAVGAALMLSLGEAGLPRYLSFPIGLVIGWGHTFIESYVRSWRAGQSAFVMGETIRGTRINLKKQIIKSLFLQLISTALFIFLSVMVFRFVGPRVIINAPDFINEGLEVAFKVAYWVALVSLVDSSLRKSVYCG